MIASIRSRKGRDYLIPGSYLLKACEKSKFDAFTLLLKSGCDPKAFEDQELIGKMLYNEQFLEVAVKLCRNVDWNAIRSKLSNYQLEDFDKIVPKKE